MIADIIYGEWDEAGIARMFSCPRCDGGGRTETCFESGEFGACPRCDGDGVDPTPRTYAYNVDDGSVVGDHVVCPPSFVPGSTAQVGTIVALDSSYDGPTKYARPA